jgi:hypothetical protein
MATNMMRYQAGHRVPSPTRRVREWALLVLEVLLAVGAYGGAVMMTVIQLALGLVILGLGLAMLRNAPRAPTA